VDKIVETVADEFIPGIGEDGTGDYTLTPKDKVRVSDYTRSDTKKYQNPMQEVNKELQSSNISQLTSSLRRVLQVRSQSHYIGAQKKGKLQRKNLYRVGAPKVGSGEWNTRVRRQKHTSDTLDVAVCILVDCSGSMYGKKMNLASASCVALTEALAKLGIPVEAQGFSDWDDHDEMQCQLHQMILKRSNDPFQRERMVKATARAEKEMNSNPDPEAVLYSYETLRQRREKRKLLLVLSDGRPATSKPGNSGNSLSELVKTIEREKIVEVYGVGIMDDSVEKYYTENSVLRNVDELPRTLVDIIRKKLA